MSELGLHFFCGIYPMPIGLKIMLIHSILFFLKASTILSMKKVQSGAGTTGRVFAVPYMAALVMNGLRIV